MDIQVIGKTGITPIYEKRSNNSTTFLKELERAKSFQDKNRKRQLMDLCYDMEGIFVYQMLKAMRDTVPKDNLLYGGHAEEIFQEMLDHEYAKQMSRNANFGLASELYNQLSKYL
ncbi:MAG: rod-binding protein [bacterium]|nr:rod-binding protein [bacterium]